MADTNKFSENNILLKADQLVKGEVSPIEVALWAESIDYPENSEEALEIQNTNPALYQLLSDLSLAGTKDLDGTFLYGVEEFQGWIEEYMNTKKDLPKSNG